MSSSDRYNRANRRRQDQEHPEPAYDDEIVYEDQWLAGDGDDANVPPAQSPARQASRSRPRSSPAIDGTAAQLDRLRQNLRQSSASRIQAAPPPPATRNVRRQQQHQQPRRRAPVQPDLYQQDTSDDEFDDDVVYQPSTTPSPSRRQSFTARRQSRRPAIEDPYDDEPYGADAYAGYDDYEDDFSEYDLPRPPERQARPRPQFAMPTIGRPSLPPAIARADLVNDAAALGIIGLGLAGLAGMAILVGNRVETLAPGFATHVSASGLLENFRDESALWNIPLMAGMFTLMNIVIAWFVSPLDRFASRFVLVGSLVAQFIAWVAIIRIL